MKYSRCKSYLKKDKFVACSAVYSNQLQASWSSCVDETVKGSYWQSISLAMLRGCLFI